jgi:hypothetical protein
MMRGGTHYRRAVLSYWRSPACVSQSGLDAGSFPDAARMIDRLPT